MADYQLFVVGSADYTDKVKQTEYNVVKNDVVDTWVDGNYRTRTSVIRTRITGTVHLLMKTAEYNQFLADMQTAKNADNTYNLGVVPNNKNTVSALETITAYATISAQVAYGTEGYGYHPAGMYVEVELEEA